MNPYTYSGLTDDELYEKCAMARFMLYMCVFAKDIDAFTRYCIKSASIYGDRFTYTLINSNDVLNA